MKMRETLFALLLVAAHVGAAEEALTLAKTHKKGVATPFSVLVTGKAMGADFTVTGSFQIEVQEVKTGGEVVFVEKDGGSKLSVMGMDQDLPAEKPVTVTRDRLGRLVERVRENPQEGLFTPEIDRLVSWLGETILPDKPVKMGDTWQSEFDNPAVNGNRVVVKGTFLGVEKLGETSCWKVQQSTEALVDGNGGRTVYEITAWLDAANGQVVLHEGTIKDIPTRFGPMSWTEKVERVKTLELTSKN